jgi:hypothetical protein
MPIHHPPQSSNLLDVLEKILDKGVVIAGDIKISLADVDLLTIKIRLLVASVDKAREIGMDWWEKDPYYSSKGIIAEKEHSNLIERINRLEQVIEKNALPLPMESEAFPILNDESSSSSFQTEESSSNHHLPHKSKKKEK